MKLLSIVAGAVLAVGLLGGANAATSGSKDIVLAYYRMMFQDKDVEQAMDTYVSKNLIQHDPYLGDGAAAMTDFFVPYYEQHPQASAEIKRVIAEGDIVVVHALWKETPEDTGQAMVDIFRVENSKIVEHWNVSQDIPENPANKNTMF
ncbi:MULTISPECIES: nuclear transport factor 2 family protein [unclassified Achromobacter]|uniref:nuclear transport factor 2 family protein n=1 Tax=unclassified Achromobacter TaxID=2626865 RepID=UPI000B51836A|nr:MULTISPECIES: nuclear transport factor 2 family protein [unclassified Achromobacter]OWT74361.1 polyketide cyclase [Achromobacter sp. HZ34]OWT78828.1 polyketide cyclase [Achromobacter sp. HZ28]